MAIGSNLATKTQNQSVESPARAEQVSVHDSIQEQSQENAPANSSVKEAQQYCVFKTSKEEYALSIDQIKEVVKYKKPTPVPQMPNYIIGMTNIRGNVFGILDIEKYFKVDRDTAHNFLLVLDHQEYKMSIAIPEVPDSMMIENDEIENLNAATLSTSEGAKFIKGVIKRDSRMIIVFDIESMISDEHFTVVA
ncbi:MAG: chemotaxis protein CheW [Bacteroidota bacterium]